MTRRTLTTTAAALTAAATLLLTACGGGNDKSSDDIKGADKGSSSPSASASASATTGGEGPDITMPKDLHLVFDFDKPSEAKHAAALAYAQNYIRALDRGIAQQDPNDPAYQFYSLNQAEQYAKSQIQTWVKGGWTVTGTDNYYDADVTTLSGGQGTLVTFCRNQEKFYGKEIKTEKILYTKPSLKDYQTFRLTMIPPSGSSKVWKTRNIEVIGKAKECQR
ncbi:hypothetical protein [Streptomyces sp. NBC_00847]|uniref:hypothetical protein n=1 Tax=Streptomyces sp. NBC_00847 TaxID=2975850 RepID=UPI00224D8E25|nr:hypothetical protein [Streptomyces sp. NBC_00847]MCX4882848.1 hypothetical protein [Streptomyces sp. NBC_00847]